MIKKVFLNFIKVILITLPIIVFCTDFIKTFWGPIYKININSSNITSIEETLQKDNIEIENIENVIKIELCGQGLWDYESLDFYYSDGKVKSVYLYTTEQHYYIEEYLYKNTFNYDYIFIISIFISLSTICVTIYVSIRKKKQLKREK
jgi:hypothetical protein